MSARALPSAVMSQRQDHDFFEWSVTLILGQRPAQGVECITQESLRWAWHLLSESADPFYKGTRPSITMAGIGVSMHLVLQLDNSAHLSRAFWLIIACESYFSETLSQVQYLQHCAVLLAQLHPVSVLLDIQFQLITQKWFFFNIKQALLSLQSSSGMPLLCLGLELAEACFLSAFS